MVIYCFMQPLLELAAMISVIVPCNAGFHGLKSRHRKEYCSILGDKIYAMHSEARARQVYYRNLWFACLLLDQAINALFR